MGLGHGATWREGAECGKSKCGGAVGRTAQMGYGKNGLLVPKQAMDGGISAPKSFSDKKSTSTAQT